MAKVDEMKQQEAAIGEAVSKTESFLENHSKAIVWGLVALFVVVGAVYGYRKLVVEPRAEKASELMAEAQYRFEQATPDYELALNGDENGAGFLDVIDQYGSTPAGNLAKHYAGVCYLKSGDLDTAAEYLAKFSPVKGLPGEVVNAQNLGLQGDIAVDKGDYEAAVKFFAKAVKASDNIYTTPLYLRKQGLALQALGRNAEAVELFEQILADYPASMDAREAEKLIAE
ncbi:MAG: tetratricopeptide repeat protein [Rikenellaceae bacterium]|nr:tetratricopeptide repeat protein [Rikenellaceae bacterium]MBQ7342271.1 tetratricopeptide repeat protein [Alistipes sp.]